jgi:hypothetical protein
VYRGRLRQSLNGEWVFNASTGQNGAVGFILGTVNNAWGSAESPVAGLQVTITYTLQVMWALPPPTPSIPSFEEIIVLTSVIPTDFAD